MRCRGTAAHGSVVPVKVSIADNEARRMAAGWYGGASDPLYAIATSHGEGLPEAVVEEAVENLSKDLGRVKKLSKSDAQVRQFGEKGTRIYQLGKGLFTKKEIGELKYMRDVFAQALRQVRGQPAAEHDPSIREMIVDSMARAFFVSDWARREEEQPDFEERGYDGDGNIDGVDLMQIAPRTSPKAMKAAKEFAKRVEKANGTSLPALYQTAVAQDGHRTQPNPADFGHYLAREAMGHGVGWFDNHPEFPLSVPSYAFNLD